VGSEPLFKKLYEEEYGTLGESLSGVCGDYYFDHGPQDVELLGEMAKIAAATHAPSWRPRRPPCSRWNPGRNSATRVT